MSATPPDPDCYCAHYDAPTEAREVDAECALAAMEAQALIVVDAATYRGAVEALEAANHVLLKVARHPGLPEALVREIEATLRTQPAIGGQ